MNTLKQQIFSGWTSVRIIRLAAALGIMAMAIQTRDWALGAVSCLFTFMALTNTGCCGANGCAVPDRPNSRNLEDDARAAEIEEFK